jgi:hypothetical protein
MFVCFFILNEITYFGFVVVLTNDLSGFVNGLFAHLNGSNIPRVVS